MKLFLLVLYSTFNVHVHPVGVEYLHVYCNFVEIFRGRRMKFEGITPPKALKKNTVHD